VSRILICTLSRARLRQLRTSRWRYLGLLALLGLYVAQSVAASPAHSVTFDEQYHLTLGYVYLAQRDLRFHHNQSPPLSEAILSAPLLARSDIQLPIEHPAYQLWGDIYLFSDAFFWHSGNDPDGLVHAGRVMAALLGVLLGLLLFVWGRQLFGEAAGWIALFLFVFDPNFIAHAIPALDLPLAFTVTLAMFALWHYLKRPAVLTLILTGLTLGLALATKYLSIMLLPAMALALLLYPAADTARITHQCKASLWDALRITRYSLLIKRLLAFALMLLIAWFVLWAAYLFQFGPINGAGLPVPAPQYFESFIGMFLKSSEGRANYLLGEVSTTGWWYYFVAAFLLKTPLPTIIVIVFALVRWPWRREWRASSVLYLPAFFFFVGASLSQLQLGYRYLLPALPFLLLMAGRMISVIPGEARNLAARGKRPAARLEIAVSVALAVWLVVSAVVTFPNHLSYFNELAGGSFNGYQYLTDSNVDWGQDLPALKRWSDLTQPDRLHLAFFGSAYPDRYGVNAIALPGYPNSAFGREADAFTAYSLEPGQYAISATSLRIGLVSRLFDAYRRFASLTPIAQPAPSILIYDVQYPAQAEVDRAVIVGPLAAEVSADDLGYRADHPLRAKYCEPGSCFILTPHSARYLTTSDLPDWVKAAAVAVPSPASNYQLYQLDATSSIAEKLQQLQGAGAAINVTYPITFENGLALAGYELQPPGGSEPPGGLTVNTYWRVTDRLEPPVAVFVHLLDQDGRIAAQDDRLGAAARMLEPGDVIAQRHPIHSQTPLPPGTYQIAIGLYNPATLERFKTQAGADRLLVGTVEIMP
jgi:hypothetical protein